MLRDAAPESENCHYRPADILEQRRVGECCAEQARKGEIESMPKRGANAATNEHDQKAHRSYPLCLRAKKSRPAADRFLPPDCTVGVISPFRAVLGDPIPIATKLPAAYCRVNGDAADNLKGVD